jgi:threonine dehydrogenase-like Zn-dependent dehydrogenase
MRDPRDTAVSPVQGLPATQHALQITGPGAIVHNRAKAVPQPGPTQLVVRVEAVGICFSDTKLLHAFTAHPRKAAVTAGLDAAALAEIPSYVPGELPTVPGHEVAARIVAVGRDVGRHRVGERVLVQTDYRHLPTPSANAAFGYNFEGGLQEYVLLDERMIIEPGTGERFLIPVGEEPSASAVALLEPWACVEASYATVERGTLLPGGRLLVVCEPGHGIIGLDALVAAAPPATVTALLADDAQVLALEAALEPVLVSDGDASIDLGTAGPPVGRVADLVGLGAASFDDIVYFGADAGRIADLQALLAPRGVLDLVLGDAEIGRPVGIDVGRIHYDLVRWVGTRGDSAADGYVAAPRNGELRGGDRVAVIGAAGPMGFMHVIRAAASGLAGLRLSAIDIDDARLAHLASVAAPLARERGVTAEFINSRVARPEPGFSYVAVMVPSPALVAEAVALAGPGARINLFAGFAVGTRADLDLDAILDKGLYLFGTSGSEIVHMKAVLSRLERGELDTNVSVDAVTGFEGIADALAAVEARTSGGKIVVYPALPEMGMIRLADLPTRLPSVAAHLDGGRWTRDAEQALLATGAGVTAGARPVADAGAAS